MAAHSILQSTITQLLPLVCPVQAAEIEASVEKFLDQVLIADFKETPLYTIEGVLEERRERDERQQRVHRRAKELFDEEMVKERHAKELRDLEEAITATKLPEGVGRPGSQQQQDGDVSTRKERRTDATAPPSAAASDAPLSSLTVSAPFKLSGAGRSSKLKPYVPDTSEFISEGEASRTIQQLRAESELLRKCFSDGRNPKAFEGFLRNSRGSAAL